MVKKFRVIVNGEAFEVEIEEVGGNAESKIAAPDAPVKPVPKEQKAAPPQREIQKREVKKPATGTSNEVTSPLPGTVLNINAKEGQTVNAGDVVLVIEAMKMENEIVAPDAGTITGISVKKGDNVQAGDLLFKIC